MIETTSWHSYPKIFHVGHPAVKDVFTDKVLVEEKVDGSQFSFGMFNDELKVRSKGKEMVVSNPEKMFQKAVDYVISIQDKLIPGMTYRCEYLSTPKHNTLTYGRVPLNNLVLFDMSFAYEQYVQLPVTKEHQAALLGIDCIKTFGYLDIANKEQIDELMKSESFLGGCKIEGLVFKSYNKFGDDKKILIAKYVSEEFKEKNATDFKGRNPTGKDFVQTILDQYKTPARWEKAIQRCRDSGQLTNSPTDIGMLIKEVQNDVIAECEAEIREQMFTYIKPKLQRFVVGGLPEFYKQKLVEKQFTDSI